MKTLLPVLIAEVLILLIAKDFQIQLLYFVLIDLVILTVHVNTK